MIGKRLPDGQSPKNAGEYAYMPYALWEMGPPSSFLGDGEWHIIDPTGGIGAIGRDELGKPAAHTVTIHEDGTITCNPSLVMPGGWHGFLIRGEFSG